MGKFYDRGFMDIKEELMKAQLIAKSFEGELLTKEYINSKTKMLWQCSNTNHPAFFKTSLTLFTSQCAGISPIQ